MVLHLFDEARGRDLVRIAAGAVAPGGRLAVVDAFHDDGAPAMDAALYSLELLARTADGRVYPSAQVTAWMQEAGLADAGRRSIGDQLGFAALLGER
jgi:hypothetical protein